MGALVAGYEVRTRLSSCDKCCWMQRNDHCGMVCNCTPKIAILLTQRISVSLGTDVLALHIFLCSWMTVIPSHQFCLRHFEPAHFLVITLPVSKRVVLGHVF